MVMLQRKEEDMFTQVLGYKIKEKGAVAKLGNLVLQRLFLFDY